MIVLVDTSVWIRFLSNRAPHAADLDWLLSRDQVRSHDFVYGELLIGLAAGAINYWLPTNRCTRRRSYRTAMSLRSCAHGICTGAASAGSMRTFWLPHWWDA